MNLPLSQRLRRFDRGDRFDLFWALRFYLVVGQIGIQKLLGTRSDIATRSVCSTEILDISDAAARVPAIISVGAAPDPPIGSGGTRSVASNTNKMEYMVSPAPRPELPAISRGDLVVVFAGLSFLLGPL